MQRMMTVGSLALPVLCTSMPNIMLDKDTSSTVLPRKHSSAVPGERGLVGFLRVLGCGCSHITSRAEGYYIFDSRPWYK